jgi:hypothetical protein
VSRPGWRSDAYAGDWPPRPSPNHDPLCPQVAHTPPLSWCLCEHNARVRADEVERRFGWVSREDAVAHIEAEVRERIASEYERLAGIAVNPRESLAYFAAARIARGGTQ